MKAGRTPMRLQKVLKTKQICDNHNDSPNKSQDPVNVFCRVRPLCSEADLSSVKVKNASTVVLTPPEQAIYKQNMNREFQYIFKHVFDPNASQREVYAAVAQPLVENLIRGKNSLLFTYGVTGSGKTFTMTGDVRHRGIMPRCLETLFRTISDFQAKKYVFKPDKMNGFEVLSETDALLERQLEMNKRFAGSGKAFRGKDSDTEIASQASCEPTPLQGLDEDNMYAVFVTYVEVYNNCVYDLLEDVPIQKQLQSKIVREDANHNMYVHGVRELEIKTVEEALEAFQMGQKRKRMGHTELNAESSRSHSVFNIRLVQAPTDCQGEHVIQDKNVITVSQLSLVDLAGSERSSRTKNTGMRLKEACNINNSLMTLRTCLELLRENQNNSNNAQVKKIPYRDSKITHLFKNYFDGEGQVSMIVCVNPRAEDYDENAHVLKFAEMTQEVQIARPIPLKPELGLTPGRRKANKLFKIAVNNLNDLGKVEVRDIDYDIGLVYTLGAGFPEMRIDSPEGETVIQELMQYLLQRIEKRKVLVSDLNNRCNSFRLHLMHVEKENLSLRTELESLKAVYKQERDRNQKLENKLRIHESSLDNLNLKISNRERQIDDLTRKLNEHQNLLSLKEQEKEKQKKKINSKWAVEVDKKNREFATKFQEQREKFQGAMRIKDEKIRLVSDIIQSNDLPAALVRNPTADDMLENRKPAPDSHQTARSDYDRATSGRTDIYCTPRNPRRVAAANNRHRRSRSAGDKWLEHRAANPVPLGTILQPYLKNRKSVTKLTDMKDLTGNKATKYCLVAQEADTDGDVETKLYKGNVIPTCGGGAQVVFDDVECLKQKSPIALNRKRPSNGQQFLEIPISDVATTSCFSGVPPSTVTLQDVNSRCKIGIEGHSTKRSKI